MNKDKLIEAAKVKKECLSRRLDGSCGDCTYYDISESDCLFAGYPCNWDLPELSKEKCISKSCQYYDDYYGNNCKAPDSYLRNKHCSPEPSKEEIDCEDCAKKDFCEWECDSSFKCTDKKPKQTKRIPLTMEEWQDIIQIKDTNGSVYFVFEVNNGFVYYGDGHKRNFVYFKDLRYQGRSSHTEEWKPCYKEVEE